MRMYAYSVLTNFPDGAVGLMMWMGREVGLKVLEGEISEGRSLVMRCDVLSFSP